MKIPKNILSNNERVPHFEKISTQILLKNQKDRVIIIQNSRVLTNVSKGKKSPKSDIKLTYLQTLPTFRPCRSRLVKTFKIFKLSKIT